ncbi:unnamed protein product [Rhizophagus irregularis]|nr:unnamed protein product [Rhizophagus irregularis]
MGFGFQFLNFEYIAFGSLGVKYIGSAFGSWCCYISRDRIPTVLNVRYPPFYISGTRCFTYQVPAVSHIGYPPFYISENFVTNFF